METINVELGHQAVDVKEKTQCRDSPLVFISRGRCVVEYEELPKFIARAKALAAIEKQYEGADLGDSHVQWQRARKIKAVETVYGSFCDETDIRLPVEIGIGLIQVTHDGMPNFIEWVQAQGEIEKQFAGIDFKQRENWFAYDEKVQAQNAFREIYFGDYGDYCSTSEAEEIEPEDEVYWRENVHPVIKADLDRARPSRRPLRTNDEKGSYYRNGVRVPDGVWVNPSSCDFVPNPDYVQPDH